eukprot:11648994-Alexandrium_andersonii.AAC.1
MLAFAAAVAYTVQSRLQPPSLLQDGPWIISINVAYDPLSACTALISCAVAATVAALALFH